ncbi:MAG: hypothetical protein K2K75_10435 [Muribaculaceae bacterium]|nr:hypothetical protein [Muribaculaceae bacterium]MDE6561788.1 hypothetical protein [Muribaculaceae bacterium]
MAYEFHDILLLSDPELLTDESGHHQHYDLLFLVGKYIPIAIMKARVLPI